MMDNTSDSSNVEQSAVSVRLVNDEAVKEHLLGLIDASDDMSAHGLTAILLDTLESFIVRPATCKTKLVGQSYDGAPAMSGELNGVQKQIQDHFPAAFYNHCVAHRMSFCASQTSMSIPKVAHFFGTADKLVSFFRSSPKHTRNFGQNLPRPGDTRWLSCDTAVTAIDAHYEAIGNFLYGIVNDTNEKPETRATARGLGGHIQQVEFLYFLKLYRKLFEHCAPMITVMQRPTIDPIQLRSMLNDFQRTLNSFDYHQVWDDTKIGDPEFPAVRARGGWRGLEQGIDGSQESWKTLLEGVAKTVTKTFSEQLAWRFANLEKFKWMELIHPMKFESQKKATAAQQRALIGEAKKLYPFVVPNLTATEHNLDILYNNKGIKILLEKIVLDRDSLVAKKKERRQKHIRTSACAAEEHNAAEGGRPSNIEENDEFEIDAGDDIDLDVVREGAASLQDLLLVIKKAELEEALPETMALLELAATMPLTSVHCERVFSRMKRVVTASRSRMKQNRKEQLVFLQVEHKILRWLAGQPSFKDNVVARFKAYNRRRFERFSKK